MSSAFVEVAFPIPLNKTFHYRSEGAAVGCRVLAPFGPKKNLVGYVVGQTNKTPSFPTKPILSILDDVSFIDSTMLELSRWVADRYLCSLGEALACVMPPALAAPKRPKNVKREALGVPATGDRPTPYTRRPMANLQLTPEQKTALLPLLAAVDAGTFGPFLIRGITDSGKTELYLRAIDQVLAQRRQALYLLPEIALTPPFLEQLEERYGTEKVAIWHSGLSGGERYRTWKAVRQGGIEVLLGARSAVFAPFPRLGLIVLDEEHEGSYKQEDRPRYHTRDVALKRAELSASVLIMGSATPSLESYWKARQGIYTLLEMTSRVEQRLLPPVELIDQRPPNMANEGIAVDVIPAKAGTQSNIVLGPGFRRGDGKKGSSFSVFSEPLKLAIEQRLARREQVMLFVNRRGFTPFLRCSKCGWVSRCARCSTTMTTHLGSGPILMHPAECIKIGPDPSRYMQCHACSRREPIVIQCPACKSMRLHQYGVGTQKVEEELKRLFPFVKVARLDRDVASQRRMYEKIYKAFLGGELDVLVGTQMIAKGFNFPNVTLVGVVDADVSLHLPDFRSAERTFDLLTQVAGRTGRGESKGKVLVQTHHPEHYALQAARQHDYIQFYDQEIGDRERLRYPPFCRLVNLVLRAPKESDAQQAAQGLAEALNGRWENLDILGPAPAPYSRLRNQFRYQILLKGTEEAFSPCLAFLRGYRAGKAFLSVDVDPSDLL